MTVNIINKLQDSMTKTIEKFKLDLYAVRTGRANPSILSKIKIEYYNVPTFISQIATITAINSQTLVVTPWEKNLLNLIEKEIINANIGLIPVNLGDFLKIPVPKLNEERRKEMVRLVRIESEKACVSIRSIRRASNLQLKSLKQGKISDDDISNASSKIQNLTDEMVKKIKSMTLSKENDLMNI
jgi:ribosome recycling factor